MFPFRPLQTFLQRLVRDCSALQDKPRSRQRAKRTSRPSALFWRARWPSWPLTFNRSLLWRGCSLHRPKRIWR